MHDGGAAAACGAAKGLHAASRLPPLLHSLVDSLFQQCYKPNARLLAPAGEELQRVRAAANRHAAFVLDIRCGLALPGPDAGWLVVLCQQPALAHLPMPPCPCPWRSCSPYEYEVAHEAEGALVQFRSSEALLAAVRQALLRAWHPTLSNSLLAELERMEGGGAPPATAAAGHLPPAVAEPAEPDCGAGPGRSSGGLQHAKGSGRQLAGSKQSLASRLVRYNAVAALPLGSSQGRGSGPASSGALPAVQPPLEGEPPSKRSCPAALASRPVLYPPRAQPEPAPDQAWLASLHLRPSTQQQQQQQQQQLWSYAQTSPQLHPQPQTHWWQQPVDAWGLENWPGEAALVHAQVQPQQIGGCGSGELERLDEVPYQPRPQASQRLAVDSEDAVRQLIASWGADSQQQLLSGMEEQEESLPQLQPAAAWQGGPLGSSEEVDALLGSWQPLPAGGWVQQQGWRADQLDGGWEAAPDSNTLDAVASPELLRGSISRGSACMAPKEPPLPPLALRRQQPQPAGATVKRQQQQQPALPEGDQALLQAAASAAGMRSSRQRPHSAPARASQQERAAASRPAWQPMLEAIAPPPVPPCKAQQHDDPRHLQGGGASGVAAPEPQPAPAAAAGRSTIGAQPPAPAPPAEPQPVPDFLQPAAGGLEELLAPAWQRPLGSRPAAAAVGPGSSNGGGSGILALETLSAAALRTLKPAAPQRQHLQSARVLAQIDRKFVAAVSGRLLLLVDQHAAGLWADGICAELGGWAAPPNSLSSLWAPSWEPTDRNPSLLMPHPCRAPQTSACSWSACATCCWGPTDSRAPAWCTAGRCTSRCRWG